ncbi:acetyltransferase [uncultured archaeon]|nr:acetyltransferase [uncultured archaeon]
MTSYGYEGRKPKIDGEAYIFPNATVIGDVTVGKRTWVGPGAVLRGDYGKIEVGDFTAIEDNCVVHSRPGETTRIGSHVTMGHNAVVHTAKIKDWAVIGMGSVVSDFAELGEWSAVGEGAVVKNKDVIPDRKIAVGIPAKVVAEVTDRYVQLWTAYKERYNAFCVSYSGTLEKHE